MIKREPILVTGAPRSGTTWVGRIVATAPSVRYIHEPFNISGLPCSCGVRFDYWFSYITPENERRYRSHIEHTLGPSLNKYKVANLIAQLWKTRRLRTLLDFAGSLTTTRSLVKDPLALCSAEWLASAFDTDVIVVIRHPAAFVNSYRQLGWSHSFSHFLSQPLLMRDHLSSFQAEISEYVNHEHSIIDQATLLWRLLHHMIRDYQRAHPDWCFVRHEDLVRDPLSRFRAIFDRLGLPFGAQALRAILQHSEIAGPDTVANPYTLRRNREAATKAWRTELTPEEIERIRGRVADIAGQFYCEGEW